MTLDKSSHSLRILASLHEFSSSATKPKNDEFAEWKPILKMREEGVRVSLNGDEIDYVDINPPLAGLKAGRP